MLAGAYGDAGEAAAACTDTVAGAPAGAGACAGACAAVCAEGSVGSTGMLTHTENGLQNNMG